VRYERKFGQKITAEMIDEEGDLSQSVINRKKEKRGCCAKEDPENT
jgi:hypothetical protein